MRRIEAEDPALEVVYRNAAGIDVGNESHMASAPPERDGQPIREFGSWTQALEEMAVWLKGCGIERVVMQSTGVYWIALYDVLEKHGLEVCLTNARDTRNLPGRKSDVEEAQWLRKLYSYGLLRHSYRPAEEIHSVRTLWRLRDRHVKEMAEEIQHMQKALTQMNVQLANTISDISGVTGQAIIRAILAGERDPYKLAELKDYRIQASDEEIARSLEGTWRRICGVDLTRIEGMKLMTAQTFLSEVGPDLSSFATENHLVSWLGLAPKRQISGGRLIRHERSPNKNRAAVALRMAASTLERSQSYLGVRFRSLKSRLGPGKAIKAMAAYLARQIYRMLTRGEEWVDRGVQEFEQRREQRKRIIVDRMAADLGFRLMPIV